jgi:hypothetical protein
MKKVNLKIFFIFILLSNLIFFNLQSQINNKIVVKVGELLVTSVDIQNEIITNLLINKQEITQENINNNKNFSIKNLINKAIKQSEVDKYQIKDYSKSDLQNYIKKISKIFNTDKNGLKIIFKKNNLNFQVFLEKHKTELLWNTLIFQMYRNQMNINIIEVDTEVERYKGNKSEEELKKIRENVLNEKRNEKLSLFSRSRFSNLENTVIIDFK